MRKPSYALARKPLDLAHDRLNTLSLPNLQSTFRHLLSRCLRQSLPVVLSKHLRQHGARLLSNRFLLRGIKCQLLWRPHEMRNEIQFITGGVGFSWLSQSRIAEEMPNS